MLLLAGLIVGYGWGSLWWWGRARQYRQQIQAAQQRADAITQQVAELEQRHLHLAAAIAVYGCRHQRGN